MEFAPIAVAVGAGGYAGYTMGTKIKNVMYNQMAYGKKRPFEPVNQYGFRRKIRRPNMYGFPQ